MNVDLPMFKKLLEGRLRNLKIEEAKQLRERDAAIKAWPKEVRAVLAQIGKNLTAGKADPIVNFPRQPADPDADYSFRNRRQEIAKIEADLVTLALIKDDALRVTPNSRWQRYV